MRPPRFFALPVTDGGPPKPEAAEESAQRPESAQVAPNTIALPVPQPNTCQGKPGRGQAGSPPGLGVSKVALPRGASARGGWLTSLSAL